MADAEQNDEYQYSELDSFDNESGDNIASSQSSFEPEKKPTAFLNKDIKSKALIALGVVLLGMLGYKFFGALLHHKDESVEKSAPIAVAEAIPQSKVQSIPLTKATQSVAPVSQPVVSETNSVLKQQVDSIELNQQNLQTQVSSINNQVENVNNNVSHLTDQMSKLNQTMSDITMQLNKQSEAINLLMERTKPKQIKHVIHHQYHQDKATIYYLNAVIPGRAWLIATNGSTLTVRKGTKIPGYGIVTLIDSVDGRVITSSGQTIKFSQEDS